MEIDLPQILESDGIVLRRLARADAPELLDHFADRAVTEFLDFDALTTLAEAEEIVDWANRLFDTRRGIRWTIRDAAAESFLGTCGFNTIVREHGSRGEIAYDLGRAHWGRGVMRVVMPCLLDTGFRRLGLHRLAAFVTPGNARSVRLLERHGFRHEGCLRGYGQWRGAMWDQDVFALLESEWAAGTRG